MDLAIHEFRFTQLPEPSTCVLVGLSALGMCLTGRFRRARLVEQSQSKLHASS